MANEIQVALQLTISKNGATVSVTGTNSADMAGDQFLGSVQIIGTSNEAIALGDVTATGMVAALKNLDDTNYVEIFSDSGNSNLISKIPAGKAVLIYPNAAIYARANTAPINLQVVLGEA